MVSKKLQSLREENSNLRETLEGMTDKPKIRKIWRKIDYIMFLIEMETENIWKTRREKVKNPS